MSFRLKKLLPRWLRDSLRSYRKSNEYNSLFKKQFKKRMNYISDLNLIEPQTSDLDSPMHILIVVVDGLRRQNLSIYGHERLTSPNIDNFSLKSTLYENCYSSSTWSFPSVPSIMTGLYPRNHGATYHEEFKKFESGFLPPSLSEKLVSLPEILKYLGFLTYMGTSNQIAPVPLKGRFQENVFSPSSAPCEKVISRYLAWLRRNSKKKTFAYLHLDDLHEPLTLAREYRNAFGVLPDIPNLEGWEWVEGKGIDTTESREYQFAKKMLYDSCIKYIDESLEKLFVEFQKIKNKLVFITSDHGEEMWEHTDMEKEFFYDSRNAYGCAHGHNVFGEIINVPLIVNGLSGEVDRYSENVSLCDIFPTIMEHLKIELNGTNLDGVSLYSVNAGKVESRPIVSEGTAFGFEKKAIIDGRYKLIMSELDKSYLLFDLDKDPDEKQIIEDRKVINRLKRILVTTKDSINEKPTELRDEVIEELKELGYIKK